MGTGINKMKDLISKAGLPPIKFEFGAFFTATFGRPIKKEILPFMENDRIFKALNDTINGPINEGVKKRLVKELLHIMKYGFATRAIIENISKISIITAKRDISLLKKLGLIKFTGARKTGRYILTEKGNKIMNNIAN